LTAKDITLLDNLVVDIDPLTLRLEQSLIFSALKLYQGLLECMEMGEERADNQHQELLQEMAALK
jgi:hypothetical protein